MKNSKKATYQHHVGSVLRLTCRQSQPAEAQMDAESMEKAAAVAAFSLFFTPQVNTALVWHFCNDELSADASLLEYV
jgi:hypothetical protein